MILSETRRIEPFTRFSDSMLWELQRRYYQQAGPEAWSGSTVPYHPTTNSVVADRYAKMTLAFWRDCLAGGGEGLGRIDPEKPLYIIELGTGSGRLGHGIHREVRRRLGDLPTPLRPVVVCTDIVQQNLDTLAQHPKMIEPLAQGHMALAELDLDAPPGPLQLRDGTVLQPDPEANPIVVVANYLLDTVKQDLFTLHGGVLHETLVAVELPEGEDPEVATTASGMELAYTDRPIRLPYYGDAFLDGLLETYGQLQDATVIIPAQALTTIRHLRTIGGGTLLILAADKARRRLSEWEGRGRPFVASHGSISVSANFHAVGELATSAGGRVWLEQTADTSFSTLAAVVPRSPTGVDLRQTDAAARDDLVPFGPATFQRLGMALRDAESPGLELLVMGLRASGYDPCMLVRHIDALIELVGDGHASTRADLAAGMDIAWDKYFRVADDDLAFRIGRVLYRASHAEQAARYFHLSLVHDGEHKMVFFNLGLCATDLGDLEAARGYFEQALAMDPGWEKAKKKLRSLDD